MFTDRLSPPLGQRRVYAVETTPLKGLERADWGQVLDNLADAVGNLSAPPTEGNTLT